MALSPGSRLGVYDITAPIGEGGMGQVWRATDSTLGRQVAIKILPDAFASDPERLARFEREARTLASLNHPHIAAIYGFEAFRGGGSSDPPMRALIMELVEGEDLSQRIARGAIPFDEALPIAKQIAEALEAAHEQGIIHRDLKPANVKVRPDGTVKVLDFGLAKAMDQGSEIGDRGSGSARLANSPTITTPAMTEAGTILGTAAYMSPEQAKGRALDRRSDIWAFGVVLYEMLTGRRAFSADDVAETLAAVLMKEPDWTALPPGVPPAVVTALQRCLRKDRKQRVRDIGDVSMALDGAFETVAPQSAALPVTGPPPRHRALPVAAAVVLSAAIVAGVAWGLRPVPAPPGPIAQFAIASPGGQAPRYLAISPDGRRMVFTEPDSVGFYLRAIGEVDAQPIPGTRTGVTSQSPVFSPDGESVVFYSSADGSLRRIPVSGGPSLMLAQGIESPSGITWGEDGIVFGQNAAGVFRVSPNGGRLETLATVASGEVAHGPEVLPGGKALMFTVASISGAGRWNTAKVVVQSLASGERHTIISGGADARYLSTGHVIYMLAGTAFAVAFDPETQTVRGDPVAVVTGVRQLAAGNGVLSVSSGGSLLYVTGTVEGSGASLRIPTLVDRNGKPEPLALPPRPYRRPRVSPDGRRLAVDIDEGTTAEVWIYNLSAGSAMRRLTFGGRNRSPVWSPDGRRIAFQSDRDGTPSIYAQAADGGGAAERLTTAQPGVSHTPDSWSPDGRTLLFSQQKGDSYALMALSLSDKQVGTVGGVQSLQPVEAVFSPDGRWVAYASTQVTGGALSADRGVFLQSFPAAGAAYQVPKTRLDFHPTWAPSGREIFYVSTITTRDVTSVGVETTPGVTFGPPAPVAGGLQPGFTSAESRGYDVLPDGRFITLLAADNTATGAAPPQMRIVLNWFEELKRLVPTK